MNNLSAFRGAFYVRIMTLYESVKNNITTRQAAERYGLRVGHNGMCKCPFHNDKNPSMKLDRRYHCFGCQADGDQPRNNHGSVIYEIIYRFRIRMTDDPRKSGRIFRPPL